MEQFLLYIIPIYFNEHALTFIITKKMNKFTLWNNLEIAWKTDSLGMDWRSGGTRGPFRRFL